MLLCIYSISILMLVATLPFFFNTLSKTHAGRERAIDLFTQAFLSFLVLLFLGLMSVRSLQFGVDTAAYVDIFGNYCRNNFDSSLSNEFRIASFLLDLGMLGFCDENFIPFSWAAIVGLLFLLASRNTKRYGYAAIILFSLIGFEFTSNALRQGFSIAFFAAGVSCYLNNSLPSKTLGALMVCFAIMLHSSSAIVLVAIVLSYRSWPVFISALAVFFLLITSGMLGSFNSIPGVERFLYEIYKYSIHDPDDIWIRVLVLFLLFSLLIMPFFCFRGRLTIKRALSDKNYTIAVRMIIVVLPAMLLPYFGYRLGYSIYALALFFIMHSFEQNDIKNPRFCLTLISVNGFILMAWASSSSMQSIPFI